ncbi:hypothetical protein ACS5PJ_20320 [Pseudarthrobacter sp. YS3]|uniref:hypothetical protein n=1 Tax=Pseudarthrobacter sp. YS3 TaxID=3453718 RepID=UPI003EEB6916
MNTTTLSPVPDGFVLVMDPVFPDVSAGYWQGPYEEGDGWLIETTFTREKGIAFEITPPNGDYSEGGFSASHAVAAGTALAALAAKYA